MALVLARDPAPWVAPTAALLFAFAAATDFFDGRLARRWKQTSTFGSFLDTAADKLLVSGALLALVAVGRVSAWIAFVIVGRELLIMGLRGAVSASDGIVMTPSMWGKWKATVQFIAITFAIWRPERAHRRLVPRPVAHGGRCGHHDHLGRAVPGAIRDGALAPRSETSEGADPGPLGH